MKICAPFDYLGRCIKIPGNSFPTRRGHLLFIIHTFIPSNQMPGVHFGDTNGRKASKKNAFRNL